MDRIFLIFCPPLIPAVSKSEGTWENRPWIHSCCKFNLLKFGSRLLQLLCGQRVLDEQSSVNMDATDDNVSMVIKPRHRYNTRTLAD